MTRWYWVSLPQLTFGIATEDGRIIDAAPIAKWTIGKDERQVARYYRHKGARIVPLT